MPYADGRLSINPRSEKDWGLEYTPPKDIKQWWCAAHCGPATEDTTECCGFCGRPVLECAKEFSKKIKQHPEWNHDGSILDAKHDDPEEEMACGGCGFWCHNCGRFWAQNSCGESGSNEHQAADGAELEVRDGRVYCVCGQWLMTMRPREDDD
jgi:hypothetical protein